MRTAHLVKFKQNGKMVYQIIQGTDGRFSVDSGRMAFNDMKGVRLYCKMEAFTPWNF